MDLPKYMYANKYTKLFKTTIAPTLAEGGDGSLSWTSILEHMYSPKELPNKIITDDCYGIVTSYLEESQSIISLRQSRLQSKFGKCEKMILEEYETVEDLAGLGTWMDREEMILRCRAVSILTILILCALCLLIWKFPAMEMRLFTLSSITTCMSICAIISKKTYYRLQNYAITTSAITHFLFLLIQEWIQKFICYFKPF